MATPNIANVATVKPVFKAGELGTSAADLCDVPAESCMKIDSIYVANVDGTNTATVEITISANNGSANPEFLLNQNIKGIYIRPSLKGGLCILSGFTLLCK